ncbi:MAG TPA: IscS subfamily cysteine desulfurase [Vicinamibacterales bacterium]|nr:IscS subfamily cysteine desulfurase [Vicinamibacterales bacterium]
MSRIYLDHNATTPVAPEVADRMDRALRELWGNASSVHHFGQQAKAGVDDARSHVAAMLGAEPSEVIFTGGGTESDNFAVRGVAEALEATGRRHLIASAIEHEAVLNTVKALAKRGWRVSLLPVSATGVIDPDALRDVITDDTALVSVMHANNEIGTIQPIAEIAAIAKASGAMVHTDAVQTAGKIPIDVKALGVDLVSISAHKFYGPKGIGALWLRKGVRLLPFVTGGRQERNRRAGTENVPGIVGLGAAAQLALTKMAGESARLRVLRDRLEDGVLNAIDGAQRNGAAEPRVPNTSNISFERIESESLLIGLDLAGIAVSSGSACSSGTLEPSHVLKAMGLPHARTLSSIRFSLGASNTNSDIDRVIEALPALIEKLRRLSTVGGRK